MKRKKKIPSYAVGSGDVFKDIGVKNPDAPLKRYPPLPDKPEEFYIPYSSMGRRCKRNGTRKEIKNKYGGFPEVFLLCTKYNEICSSEVCREERGVALKGMILRGVHHE